MAIQNSSDQAPMADINVTPLVDVMLVLLIVFIVTAPLLMQAVKVNLPKTAAVEQVKETHTLQLAVDAQGAVFVDRNPVALDALEGLLKAEHDSGREITVQVHADERVPYGRVAQVLAVAQRAGITRLAMVTVEKAAEK